MNRKEHIMTTFVEECGEVAQRVTKALRFSLPEIQPGQNYTNAERIMHEWADLNAMMEKMVEEGIVSYPADYEERLLAKAQKFEKFLGRSAEHGTLTEERPKAINLKSDVKCVTTTPLKLQTIGPGRECPNSVYGFHNMKCEANVGERSVMVCQICGHTEYET